MSDRGSAVVVGAGIGGLAASIALSRVGRDVVVVERDDTPMPDDVEGAFEWDRRGAPQVRHTHGFPALIRVILRDRYPDVLEALVDAGVGEVSIMPPMVAPGSPTYEENVADLQVLSCRRTTLEWVLRRCALAEPNVRFQVGVRVAGLLVAGGDAPPLDVRGVRLADGTELPADMVVASTGRRDAVPAWFAEHGVDVPEEEHPTGTVEGPRPPRLDLATLRRIAASGDPELAVSVSKTMSLLLTPQEVFGDPEVLERLASAASTERPPRKGPTRKPLTRDDILAAGRP